MLWGLVLSAGVMTKISFLYFVVLIGPTLFIIRLRHSGIRNAGVALFGFVVSSMPAAVYLLKYGGWAFANARESSFGQIADVYHRSVLLFLGDSFRHAPGLVLFFVFVLAALVYLIIKERSFLKEPASLAFLIAFVFGVIVLASANRQLRYAFPAIVALPFLLAVILSGKQIPISRMTAALTAGLVLCALTLAALPVRHRAQRQASLARCDAVLAQAIKCGYKHILLTTDGPALNGANMYLAMEVTRIPVEERSLAYNALYGVPIDEDFRQIRAADLVVFQDDGDLGSLMNLRVRIPAHRRYVSELREYAPAKVYEDVTTYSKPCNRSDHSGTSEAESKPTRGHDGN
jgi:hypothetical protein